MTDFLIVINIILAVTLSVMQFDCWRKIRKIYDWSWIRLLFVVIGSLWALIYTYRLTDGFYDLPYGAEVSFYIIRPTITLTLAALLANILISRRRHAAHNKSS